MPDVARGGDPGRQVVVIGASAGGIGAVSGILRELPGDFPAAIFIVIHIPATIRSALPSVLSRHSALVARHPQRGEAIECGRAYVAPPDHHLLMDGGRVLLSHGPEENGFRPAIDVLFRSAALHHGPGVVGVVLSGVLGDGAIGLAEVKRHGGATVVQHPDDALFDDMPRRAIDVMEPDHVATAAEMHRLLRRLVAEPVAHRSRAEDPRMDGRPAGETRVDGPTGGDDAAGVPSGYTCPECHGVLWEQGEGDTFHFLCRTGHRLSPDSLLHQREREIEGALYAARRALQEQASLLHRLSERLRRRGSTLVTGELAQRAQSVQRQAQVLHEWIEDRAGGRRHHP
jgi:two-component system, chemotaxis family, protein-glutamate methylesterase/glutaminase